jgi:hypothetical protein
MADVNLNFIAKQFERITADIGMLRDDVNVLSAIVRRSTARRLHCCRRCAQ